jgi:hypothetical protein
MKKFYSFLIISLMFLSLSCDNNNVTLIGVKDNSQMENGTAAYLALSQNYPNPFNGSSTTILYGASFSMHVTLKVYTEDWVLVSTPVDKDIVGGYYQLNFYAVNSKNEILPSGDYYYTLEGNGVTLVRKMRIIN